MPVMQQVENPQRSCLAPWRNNQNQRFDIPQAKQVSRIPTYSNWKNDLGQISVPEQVPTTRPFQSGCIHQVSIRVMKCLADYTPCRRKVTDRERQKHNPNALIE